MDGDTKVEADRDVRETRREAAPAREDDREAERRGGETTREGKGSARRRIILLVVLVAVAALIGGGIMYWRYASHYESTDDAFIDGNTTQMASQIAGRVTEILVADNAHVTKGQKLVLIDPRDAEANLDQSQAAEAHAEAQLEQARAQLLVRQADVDQANANLCVSEAEAVQAKQDYDRFKSIDPRAVTRQQVDSATAAFRSAQARTDASRQSITAAEAQVRAAQAEVDAAQASLRQAKANVDTARLNLSYATIVAPADGRFTKRTVELGSYVTPGQPLFALVQDNLWVTANFKETQLTHMQPGQKVKIEVDAFPSHTLDGHVDSFQAGTGSVFSALPAENATGNYVKIVQRVPVKIVFDDPGQVAKLPLSPGMSVVPTVTVR